MELSRIIVNADDLGRTAEVNSAIFDLMADRLVTSATLIANAPAAKAAAEAARVFPEFSFGVHLNLTEYRPLTSHPGLIPLLDDEGRFFVDIRTVRPSIALLRATYGEWCAQLDRAHGLGLHVSHLDSHNHVHTAPALIGVLKKVQRRFGIDAIRRSRDAFPQGQERSVPLRAGKAIWNTAVKVWPRTRITDSFMDVATFIDSLDQGPLTFSSGEVMAHPGIEDDTDTPLLRSGWIEAAMAPVKLITYRDL